MIKGKSKKICNKLAEVFDLLHMFCNLTLVQERYEWQSKDK